MRAFASTLAVCLATALPAVADPPVKLGPAPTVGGGEYSTGGGITVAVELRASQSGTLLCGAWAESTQLPVYVRHKGRDVLKRGSVARDGKVIAQGLEFLREVPPAASYAEAPAACIRVRGAASGRLAVLFPPLQVVNEPSGREGGTITIRFASSDAPNPALKQGSLLPSWLTSSKGAPDPKTRP